MKIEKTTRNFEIIKFTDEFNVKCSLQKSSLATEDSIWFGCNDANPRVLIKEQGWQPIKMPSEYLADTRMHLTREQVAELLPHLEAFVKTGDLGLAT